MYYKCVPSVFHMVEPEWAISLVPCELALHFKNDAAMSLSGRGEVEYKFGLEIQGKMYANSVWYEHRRGGGECTLGVHQSIRE